MDEIILPLKLKCNISGKEVVYTSREYVEKKLLKYGGSLERMRKEFVCRDARRMVKDKVDLQTIQKELGKAESVTATAENGAQITMGAEALIEKIQSEGERTPAYDYSKLDFKVGQPVPLTQGATDQCYNPGWFLNKKDCGACAFTKMCNFARKRIPDAAARR